MKISPETKHRQKNVYCDKLKRKASKNNWRIEWYDFDEKSYGGNYQCFVRISNVPVTVCCGSGPTESCAHNDATMNALKYLKN
jgi:hypothetical protein